MQAANNSAEAKHLLRRSVWLLLGLSLVVLILAAVLSTGQDALTILSIFSTRFLGIFIEAAPFLLLGTLASGLIEAFISRDDIARWMPRNPVLATITGAFMGLVFPVCECGVVPVVSTMVKPSASTTAEKGVGPSGPTVRNVANVASLAWPSVT